MSDTDLEKYSSEEWDFLRKRFYNNILNETEIGKLGQNVGISWPFKGKDETPAKYIDYSLDELKEVPGFVGKMSRVKLLMNILRETLAFDDPFGDMVATVESGTEEDFTFERILEKLAIPTDYPAEFLHFSKDTEGLLRNEEVETLIGCIHFGQKLAESVVVGGDLRTFLNSLAHKDEKNLAQHMPYRRGNRGLHLPEAIGLICENLAPATKLHLLKAGGVTLDETERRKLEHASELDVQAEIKAALERLDKLLGWFKPDASDLEQSFATGGSPDRYFIPINDARRERMAVELTKLRFGQQDQGKAGFLGRLFGR